MKSNALLLAVLSSSLLLLNERVVLAEPLPVTMAFNQANALNNELLQRLWALNIVGGDTASGCNASSAMDGKSPATALFRTGCDNHWETFVDGNGIFAQVPSRPTASNFNINGGGVSVGAAYRWNKSFSSGFYAGYEGSSINQNNSGGYYGSIRNLIDNAVRYGVFGTFNQPDGKGFYAVASAGGAYHQYNYNNRSSSPISSFVNTSTSSPGAGEFDSMLAGGYDFKAGGFTFGPVSSLQFTYYAANNDNDVNVAESQSPPSRNVVVVHTSSFETSSLLYNLGAHAAYRWQASKDILVVPQISLSWQHEFLQSPYGIDTSVGGTTLSSTTATPLRDTLYTGVGFTVEIGKTWNTSFFYNASAGNSDLVSQNIFLSAGLKF